MQTPLIIEREIAANDTQSVTFDLQAFAKNGLSGYSASITNSLGANTRLPVTNILDPGLNDTTFVTFEQGAGLVIDSVRTSVVEINAGARQNWSVEVVVSNTGEAELELLDVSSKNLQFRVDGELDADYKINPPTELLGSGNLRIAGKSKDTLVYFITKNGDRAGEATLTVNLKGFDRNAGPEIPLTGVKSTALFVVSDALAQIVQTIIGGGMVDGKGNGMVNRGQLFQIYVNVRSGELLGVDSVKVALSTTGPSKIKATTVVIPHINKDEKATAVFHVTASESWDPALGEQEEQFKAEITSAISSSSTLPAEIRPPENARDATTTIRVQTRANLSLNLFPVNPADTVHTRAQRFNVAVRVTNAGTAWVDSGEVHLELPLGYNFIEGENDKKVFKIVNDSTAASIFFTIIAPDISLAKNNMRVSFSKLPISMKRPMRTENLQLTHTAK